MRFVPKPWSRILGTGAGRWRFAAAGPTAWGNAVRPALARGPQPQISTPTTTVGGGSASAMRDVRLGRLEAVLFLAREPLPLRRIGQFASLADATEARTLIRRLNQLYDQGGSAFRVEEVAGGFQLLTRRKFAGWLRRLHPTSVETRLSSPALETLAVVAYRQPVLRADVEAVRGVQCGEMLRQLLERDLIRIAGRSDDLGRPFLYGTTKRFLRWFGLRQIDELPRADLLRNPAPTSSDESLPDASRSVELLSTQDLKQESHVSIVAQSEPALEEVLDEQRRRLLEPLRAADDEDEEDEEFEDDDEGEDDEEESDEDDEEFDDDFDDEDWEEVDDDDEEEEDDEWDEEDDEEWEEDDEEDDDWEEEEEEEEEE